MSNVIFKTESVTKAGWYSRLKEIMTEAGWKSISSRATDYDVMFSEGESGDKEIYINLREHDSTSTYISKSTSASLFVRLLQKYVPGASGGAGTFTTPTSWYRHIILKGTAFSLETKFLIHYHCNKDRIIIINEFPPHAGNALGSLLFLGCSEQSIAKEYKNSGAVFASSDVYSLSTGILSNYYPDNNSGEYALTPYFLTPEKSINDSKYAFMSDIVYGHTVEGLKGKIDGVYVLNPSLNITTGDKIQGENEEEYRIIIIDGTSSQNSYGSIFGAGKVAPNIIAIRTK